MRPHGGHPRAIHDEQWASIVTAVENGMSKAAVCRTFGLKRATLYDTLARSDLGLRDLRSTGCPHPGGGDRPRRRDALV